jgi:hypothetical protein
MDAGMPSQLPELETRRAYEADAVDQYVASLYQELADLRERLEEALQVARDAEQRSGVMENAEILLGRALLRAQRMAEEIIDDANRRARLIIAEAREDASDTLANVRRDAQHIIDQADETVETVFASLERPASPSAGPSAPAGPWRNAPPVAPEPEQPPARVVDFRARNQFNNTFTPPARYARTGTEDAPVVGPRQIPRGDGWPQDLVLTATPAPPPATVASPAPNENRGFDEHPVGLAMLRERWRVARSGPSALDDDLLSRSGHLESLADGSYVDELRTEGGAFSSPPLVTPGEAAIPAGSRREWRLFRRVAPQILPA